MFPLVLPFMGSFGRPSELLLVGTLGAAIYIFGVEILGNWPVTIALGASVIFGIPTLSAYAGETLRLARLQAAARERAKQVLTSGGTK